MIKVSVYWKKVVLWSLTITVQLFIATIVLLILYNVFNRNNFNFSSLGTWHVILCSMGYGLLMTEGLIVFSGYSMLTYGVKKQVKTQIHSTLMILATLFVTIGILLKIGQKPPQIIPPHARTGLISWIFAVCGLVLGITSNKSSKLNTITKPVTLKLIHSFTGISAYIIGFGSLYLGAHKLLNSSSENTKILISSMIWLVGFFTTSSAFISMWFRLKSFVRSSYYSRKIK